MLFRSLASEKRVAIGADFYVDVALMGRTGRKRVAARAMHAHFVVCGMDSCLHGVINPRSEFLDFTGVTRDSANVPPPQASSRGGSEELTSILLDGLE